MRTGLQMAAPLTALLVLSSCAHSPAPGSELFAGHERTYLTMTLAHNSIELDLLQKLHRDDRDAAIDLLKFELDARVLFLTDILNTYGTHPVVEETRDLIACHLNAIARYREQHGAQTRFPEIAELANEALRQAPKCADRCPISESSREADDRRPTNR